MIRRLLAALAVWLLAITPAQAAPPPGRPPVDDLGYDPFDQSKVPLEVGPPADFKGKTVLLIAGRKSHPPAQHEFFAGTAVLMNLLKQTPGVWPVMARDGWPKDESLFDKADAVVFFMDGRDGHPAVQGDRLKFLQKHIDRGIGWVNLHYAVDYKPEHGQTVVGWMGGYYDPRTSTNPHWDADFRALPKHPITNGVRPFTIRDEWYFNMHWVGDCDGREGCQERHPDPASGAAGQGAGHRRRQEVPGPAGDDGLGLRPADRWAGVRVHRRALPPQLGGRELPPAVVNAVLWAAKADVPDGGAKVDFDPADLNRNLDNKGKPFEKIVPPTGK